MGVTVLVPLKPLAVAKSRLRVELGAATSGLVLAMALDVVRAGLLCLAVDQVVLITDDPLAADAASRLGAAVVSDAPGLGLNELLEREGAAVRATTPDSWLLVQPGDCPAVRPEDITALASACLALGGRSFVRDAAGTGTTSLIAGPGQQLQPRYGVGSRDAHLATGARELDGRRWRHLAQDVDTGAELVAAEMLGVGPHTQTWLRSRS
jgi:2-phospho-L-lactate guanylyltransferase